MYYVQGQQEISGMGHDFPEIRFTAPPPLCCSFMRFLDVSLHQTHAGSRQICSVDDMDRDVDIL